MYKELYFKGSEQELNKFINGIGSYAKNGWRFLGEDKNDKDDYGFSYKFKEIGEVIVIINKKKVRAITPQQINNLNTTIYNNILYKFCDDIISEYKKDNKDFSSCIE